MNPSFLYRWSALVSLMLAMTTAPLLLADEGSHAVEERASASVEGAAEALRAREALSTDGALAWAWIDEVERYAIVRDQWRGVERREAAVQHPARLVDVSPPRAVFCDYGICVLHWLHAEELTSLVTERVVVREDGDLRVSLLPGARVQIDGNDDFIARPSPYLPAETGLVPEGVVGRWFQRSPAPREELDHAVLAPLSLWETAADVGGDQAPAMTLTEEAQAWRVRATVHEGAAGSPEAACRVTLATEWREVDGWVSCAALDPLGVTTAGSGGGGWGCSHCNILTLPADTWLFDAPEGDEVGRVGSSEARVNHMARNEAGWIRVGFPGMLGDVEAWVAPGVVE